MKNENSQFVIESMLSWTAVENCPNSVYIAHDDLIDMFLLMLLKLSQ